MESKCLLAPINVNENIFSESQEIPIDIDFTLPDYCSDILKIFKVRHLCGISSKSINGKMITLDGTVNLTILYLDNENKLCSYEYLYPFNKNLETQDDLTGCDLILKTKCEYLNCRAVTGRKIDIHGAVAIDVKALKRKATEIVSDIDDGAIEVKRESIPATVPMGYTEKYTVIDEDIMIGQGQPEIKSIFRYEARPVIKESKIINGKVVCKGELSVIILYCATTGERNPQIVKSVIPFSQIVDVNGINESCECESKANLCFLEIKPRTSSSNEVKSFVLNAKIEVSVSAFCVNDIEGISDAFSRKYSADMTKSIIKFDRIIQNINETYHCKKSIDFDEEIGSVIDMWCDVASYNTKFSEEGMTIEGNIICSIIGCNNQDELIYCEKNIDFCYKCTVSGDYNKLYSEPQLEVVSCGYTITSPTNIEIRVDLDINASIYESNSVSLVVDFVVDENKPSEKKSKGAMTIYFPSDEETLWDIARKYSASIDEIKKINELEDENIESGKMILIPVI